MTTITIGTKFIHCSRMGHISEFEVINFTNEDGIYHVDVKVTNGKGWRKNIYRNIRVYEDSYFESNHRLWIKISPQEQAFCEVH